MDRTIGRSVFFVSFPFSITFAFVSPLTRHRLSFSLLPSPLLSPQCAAAYNLPAIGAKRGSWDMAPDGLSVARAVRASLGFLILLCRSCFLKAIRKTIDKSHVAAFFPPLDRELCPQQAEYPAGRSV